MAEVRATFDNQDNYKKFLNALESSITLGEGAVTPDPISYSPGTTVTITCDEEDVEPIIIIILRYGKTAP